MKKYIYQSFIVVMLVFFATSCAEETPAIKVMNTTTSGAILRTLSESNKLDLSDNNSTYSLVLELQDAGNVIKGITTQIQYNDHDADKGDKSKGQKAIKAKPYGSEIKPSDFKVNPAVAKNTHNLPVYTYTTTLQEIMTGLGIDATKKRELILKDDVIQIKFEVETQDGRKFNSVNASGGVTTTGLFAFFNSRFTYSFKVKDSEILLVDSATVKNKKHYLKSGAKDTLVIRYNKNTLTKYHKTPVVVMQSSKYGNTDITSQLQLSAVNKDTTYRYAFEAGSDVADTITFQIKDGEFVEGLKMTTVNTGPDASKGEHKKGYFYVDNELKDPILGKNVIYADDKGNISNLKFDLLYETLAAKDTVVTYKLKAVGGVFEDIVRTKTIKAGDTRVSFEILPTKNGKSLKAGKIEFDVIVDDGVTKNPGVSDRAGNYNNNTVRITMGG